MTYTINYLLFIYSSIISIHRDRIKYTTPLLLHLQQK